MNKHLYFHTAIAVEKPNSIRNSDIVCPFCQTEELTDILATDGAIIWLKNKFPVIARSFQTVLIESDDCHGYISSYEPPYFEKLLRFGFNKWMEVEESGKYKSVLFFKNHGPLSGGSIRHPHMQIVGLEDIDYQENISESDFEGLMIDEQDGSSLSLSTLPKIGFYEFNVMLNNERGMGIFARHIQIAVKYILADFPFHCNSYNLFFYKFKGHHYAKVVPRFVTSPVFIGYAIPQVPDNLQWIRNDIKEKYFSS